MVLCIWKKLNNQYRLTHPYRLQYKSLKVSKFDIFAFVLFRKLKIKFEITYH